jgi:MmyB-like transcription regulator ligand binding domain
MPTRIHHPQVGDLTLSREKLAIGGAEGQLLVLYHAQSGTSSAEKLALLASLAGPTATARNAIREHPTLPLPDSPGHV